MHVINRTVLYVDSHASGHSLQEKVLLYGGTESSDQKHIASEFTENESVSNGTFTDV